MSPFLCGSPGRLADDGSDERQQQASGKRPGTKSREVVHRRCGHDYGDYMSGPLSRGATVTSLFSFLVRHDHVHMGVMGHRRAPCVQHGGEADACAEMLWVVCNRDGRLGGRLARCAEGSAARRCRAPVWSKNCKIPAAEPRQPRSLIIRPFGFARGWNTGSSIARSSSLSAQFAEICHA